MKTFKRKTAVLLTAIVIASAFTACDDLLGLLGQNSTMTIDQRIASFSTAINSPTRSATDILANFGPESSMTYYDAAQVLSYWDTAFPDANQYTFTVSDQTVTTAVVVTGTTENSSGNTIATPTYTFKMYQETSGNYLIQEIWETGVTEALIKKIDF